MARNGTMDCARAKDMLLARMSLNCEASPTWVGGGSWHAHRWCLEFPWGLGSLMGQCLGA